MPITRIRREKPAAESNEEGPSGLRRMAGTAVRVGAGFLPTSVMGNVPGAATAGGAELLAELLEGSLSKSTPARVAMEAGIGAIPLGKTLSAGRALLSAGKSGAISGAGDVGRQFAEGNFSEGGEGWNKDRTLMATGIGAASGGILGKFFHGEPPPAPKPKVVIENMGGGIPNSPSSARVAAGSTTYSGGAATRGTKNYEGGVDTIEGYSPRTASPAPAASTKLEKLAETSGSRAVYDELIKSGVSPDAAMAHTKSVVDRIVSRRGSTPPSAPFSRTPIGMGAAAEPEAEQSIEEVVMEALNGMTRRSSPYANELSDVKTAIAHDRTVRATKAASNATREATERGGVMADLEKMLGEGFDELPNLNAEASREGAKMMDQATKASDDLGKSWKLEDQKYGQQLADELELEATKASLQKQPPTVTETVKTPGQTQTIRYKVADEVDEGAEEAAQAATAEASSPQIAEEIARAIKSVGKKTRSRLTNLDEEGMVDFNYYHEKEGLSEQAAYRKAFYEQGVRRARAKSGTEGKLRPTPTEPTPPTTPPTELANVLTPANKKVKTPKTAPAPEPPQERIALDAEQRRNVTHPSFYDEGVEGLENAADIAARRQSTHPSFYDEGFEGLDDAGAVAPRGTPPKGGPPPAAAAKLAEAEQRYAPEVTEELKRASAIYNDPNASREAKKAAGKTLRQLTDFMEGKGKFAPKADGSAPSQTGAAPDWVAEQTQAVEQLAGAKKPGRGTTLGAGLGGVQDAIDIAKENPQFAATSIGTILGGVVGGGMDAADDSNDSSWDGALLGAGLGAGASLAPKLVQALGRSEFELGDPSKIKEMAVEIVGKIPQFQRYSMLMGQNLPANAWIGPWGAVLTGAIEGMLKGDHRAIPLLKEAWNPLEFARQAFGNKSSWDEAYDRIRFGELGRDAVDDRLVKAGGDLTTTDKLMISPGLAMTAGDVHARRMLEKFGYSPEEARLMTMTGEPEAKLTRDVANFGKGSWLGNMILPFKRTPANILEQGAQRLPGIGALVNKSMGRDVSNWDAAVEQLSGLGAIGAGYGAAALNPDDTTRRNSRAYITNAAGRYSLPATIGFMLGDASARGEAPAKAMVDPFNWQQALPLPTTEPLIDIAKAALPFKENKSAMDYIPQSMQLKPLRKVLGMIPGLEAVAPAKPPARGLRRVRRARTE